MDPEAFKHVDVGLDENGVLIYSKDGGRTARRVVPVQPITSPLDIPGCVLLLDARDLMLDPDDPVALWPDASDSGYDAAQDDSDRQPIYETNIFGALPGVRFEGGYDGEDGTNPNPQYLSLSGNGLGVLRNLEGLTLACVAKADVDTYDSGGYPFLASDNASTDNARGYIDVESNLFSVAVSTEEGNARNATQNSSFTDTTAGSEHKPVIGVAAFSLINGLVDSLLASIYPGAVGTPSFEEPAQATRDTDSIAVTIGGWYSTTSSLSFGGHLGLVAVYNRTLTMRERRELIEYLAETWSPI